MMHLIDSHCHLNFDVFDADREQVLARCADLGVRDIVVPATTIDSWSDVLALCERHPQLHPTLGLHPLLMDQHPDDALARLEQALSTHQVVAIGEIGLDFYFPGQAREAQTALFNGQITLAEQFDLPVILHVRKAHDQVLKILRNARIRGGIAHAFNGSLQQAEQYRELGFLFGVGGALTYPRATKLQKLFTTLPADSIVLETDSPDMPLAGQQGERNSPENIPLILTRLAELRSETEQALAKVTTDNCRRLFGF
jgi:TatD DNase family protein